MLSFGADNIAIEGSKTLISIHSLYCDGFVDVTVDVSCAGVIVEGDCFVVKGSNKVLK